MVQAERGLHVTRTIDYTRPYNLTCDFTFNVYIQVHITASVRYVSHNSLSN